LSSSKIGPQQALICRLFQQSDERLPRVDLDECRRRLPVRPNHELHLLRLSLTVIARSSRLFIAHVLYHECVLFLGWLTEGARLFATPT
jgi:hypothetical protein